MLWIDFYFASFFSTLNLQNQNWEQLFCSKRKTKAYNEWTWYLSIFKYLSFKQVKAALHHVDRVSMVIPLIDNANHVIQDVAHAQTEPRPPLVQLAQMIDT